MWRWNNGLKKQQCIEGTTVKNEWTTMKNEGKTTKWTRLKRRNQNQRICQVPNKTRCYVPARQRSCSTIVDGPSFAGVLERRASTGLMTSPHHPKYSRPFQVNLPRAKSFHISNFAALYTILPLISTRSDVDVSMWFVLLICENQ